MIIAIDQGTAGVLEAWRERQLFERLEWDTAWTDTGYVFTREDGQPLRAASVSEHMETLVRRAGLPPVRFHDLRHGAATMLIAAGQPCRAVPVMCQHGRERAAVTRTRSDQLRAFAQLAEADGNRTRQRCGAALTSFEDRGDHQVPRRLRVDSMGRRPGHRMR